MFVTVCWQKTQQYYIDFQGIGISFWIQPPYINDKAVVVDVSLLKRQPLKVVFDLDSNRRLHDKHIVKVKPNA